jgi:Uma2 family endonuclease
MTLANVRFNYQDYLQLPEDKRYEILDGELYVLPTPNTRHQRVSQRILMALIRQTEERDLGEIFRAPCDVVFSAENIAQPDILFIRTERFGIIGDANIQGAPDLVIEILSPATRHKDFEIKRKIYAGFGVQEYWIVDPDAATVEVLTWKEAGYITAAIYREPDLLSSPLLPEVALPLSEIFP